MLIEPFVTDIQLIKKLEKFDRNDLIKMTKLTDSKILIDNALQHKLGDIIGNGKSIYPIYRGTEHGFRATDIHTKIDKINETVVIVRSDTGKVFGGYTNIPWDNKGGNKSGNGSSFLFSISDDHTFYKFNHINGGEVYHSGNRSMTFNGSLGISNNCDVNNDSWALLGTSYNQPKHL